MTRYFKSSKYAGFIERYAPINLSERSKKVRYRLLDEYLNFYYRFVEPHVPEIQSAGWDTTRLNKKYGLQKILILGKETSVPQSLRGYFDRVLLAHEIFWNS